MGSKPPTDFIIKCFLFFTKCRYFPILSAFVLHTVYCYVFKEKKKVNKMYGRPIGGFGYGGYGYPYYSDYSYYTGYQQDPYYSYNTY
ncbi:hypothetical protein ACT7C1_32325 [Bacillus paranthracis]